MSASALFVIGSGVQLDSALRVAAHLSRPTQLLDIWTGEVVPAEKRDLAGHLAPVTRDRLRRVAVATKQWARDNPGGVLVAPQDVGLVFRRIVAVARRAGATIALLPDGAVSAGKVTGRSAVYGLLPLADGLLRAVGFAAGQHGRMGASQPDVALSWGPAWDDVFRSYGVTNIHDVGNPRSDDLATLPAPEPAHLLICSQPMDHAAIGGQPAAAVWYEFLDRTAAGATTDQLRIRLHPAEQDKLDSLPIAAATRTLLTSGTSLAEDIGWSGAVFSWASTTMMEAAGANRAVVSLAVNEAARDLASGYFFQRDPRVVNAFTADVPDREALVALADTARPQQLGLADDYLVNVGSAAKTAAGVIDDL